jgi:hypothetical protein
MCRNGSEVLESPLTLIQCVALVTVILSPFEAFSDIKCSLVLPICKKKKKKRIKQTFTLLLLFFDSNVVVVAAAVAFSNMCSFQQMSISYHFQTCSFVRFFLFPTHIFLTCH